ncbi:hypothetical protein, partial [Salmonella enterica]|uniref:hypothetical protein n=1 Tax=Salmonella enterica TaxID=28901 RepID=UPI003075CC93
NISGLLTVDPSPLLPPPAIVIGRLGPNNITIDASTAVAAGHTLPHLALAVTGAFLNGTRCGALVWTAVPTPAVTCINLI